MAGSKETPRQKLIGLMYLVLMALLAMNVSKEVVLAFISIDNSLNKTVRVLSNKVDKNLEHFEISYQENKVKTGKYYNKAKEVNKKSKELIDFINQIKINVIAGTENIPKDKLIGKDETGKDTIFNLKLLENKDNYDQPTRMLGLSEGFKEDGPTEPLSAKDLYFKIKSHKEFLFSILKEFEGEDYMEGSIAQNINALFNLEDEEEGGEHKPWAIVKFYHNPLVAVIAFLSKIQTDIKSTEYEFMNFLYEKVDAGSFKFNKLEPAIISESNYLLEGDSFKARVFLAAFDTTQLPVISTGDDIIEKNGKFSLKGKTTKLKIKGGMGHIGLKTSKTGDFDVKGLIQLRTSGGIKSFPFSTKYKVALPNVVVSPSAMNVFYKGVDNPVDISVAGVDSDDIITKCKNCKIKKVKNGYIVTIPKGQKSKKAKISVSVKDGKKTKLLGSSDFRIKLIPNPTPFLNGLKPVDSKAQIAKIRTANILVAKMEDFLFPVKAKVDEFKVTAIVRGRPITYKSKSNKITSEQATLLKGLKKGDRVTFYDIKASLPDGTRRPLPTLSFSLI